MSVKPGTLEALRLLVDCGSKFVWHPTENCFKFLGKTGLLPYPAEVIARIRLRYWSSIDALLRGEACNVCEAELSKHERTGEPICCNCWLDGHERRPEWITDSLRHTSEVRL